jgi:hypothetical protein
MVSVPPMPIEVGMVRTSLPLSKTVTCLVVSSAMETWESPMRKATCSSSWP